MSRDTSTPGVLTPKVTVEAIYIDFDFSDLLPAGIKVVSAVVTAAVHDGADDASPMSILQNSPQVDTTGKIVSQLVIAGVAGTWYRLTCQPTTDLDNQTPVIQLLLPVVGTRFG